MPNIVNDELLNYSHTVRVMFVRDQECIKSHTLDMLEIFFSNLDLVSNCEEAYEHFLKSKYDLIIMGLNLPEKSGIELIEKIRDISRDITILVISDDTDANDFSELIKLGVDGYIIRPVYMKQFSDVVHKTIEKLKNKQDLYEYRISLEEKVKEQVESLREKDKILSYQSKLAAMGEMIDAVAHQWKQPLNIINMKIDMLRYDYIDNLVDQDYCNRLYEDVFFQTSHMKDTLDEFRTFLRPDKKRENFSISDVLDKVLLLVKDEIIKYNITIEKDIIHDISLNGIENELKHLFLNLISNSKDAFLQNNIKDKNIKIRLYKENNTGVLEFYDNAGGIPKDIIDNIFKANVTTKEEGKGTGIGLYMSRHIVKKHYGEISVENIKDGAKFTVRFKQIL